MSCRVDQYGFERSEDHESNEYLDVLSRRSKKWSKLLQGTGNVEKNLKGMSIHALANLTLPTIFFHFK